MPMTKTSAIGRSIDIYYRDADRTKRMDALNAQFVPKGGLAFDIGAHVGDRTASFLRLGAAVVALEPQPRVFRALRLIHGRNPKAVLQQKALSATAGTFKMFVNSGNPTVSTLSEAFVAAAPTAIEWQNEVWDDALEVPVTTLDILIAEHGGPDFIKIDIEGYELAALMGLTHRVPALSFEFTTLQRDIAQSCVRQLQRLGPYIFNISHGEEHRLHHGNWVSAQDMEAELARMPQAVNSGDIYARLR